MNLCLQLSTHQARRILNSSNPIKILVDNSVLGHGSTHETVRIVQNTNWPPGGQPREVAVAYRAPRVYDEEMYKNAQYLPGIAHLARKGLLEMKTSFELLSERNHQPIGRFVGKKTWFSFNLFDGIKLASVDGHDVAEFDLNYFREKPDCQ